MLPTSPVYNSGSPAVALRITSGWLVVRVWLPTTIEKFTEVAENPVTSDAISLTAKVCGGWMRELIGGVVPAKVRAPASKDNHAGRGLLSIITE